MANFFRFFKTKWGIAIVIILVGIILFAVFHKSKSPYTLVPVTQGTISESVSVTGNTTPIQSVSLSFGNAGTVSHTYVQVGDHVTVGETLASLNTANLEAQLAQAQATVDTQQAKLDSLKAGSQPEDIDVSQAALAKAGQDLQNMYSSVQTTANDAYAKAIDAVRTQISPLFSNAENASIQLNFNTSDTQDATSAKTERAGAASLLNTWQASLATVSASSTDVVLQNSLSYLASIRQLLIDTSAALNGATGLDATTLAAYKAALTTATNEVNTVTTNVNTLLQNISSQKLVVAQAQAALALKQAGATPSDIAAQQAQVEQAQAGVASVEAQLANSVIVAPIDGVITQQDAKVGQISSPATPLISIISNNAFEVDALVPETDIGKITVGDSVSMTFDAFTGETFLGKVFYIDPAQTITQGVVDYKIKVNFNTPDPRMKSGLTANLDVKTKQDQNALILPQYAVIQNDQGNFVETLVNNVATQTPVTLGIQDENGNVEILSGVTAGEQVINIGLKQ